MVPQGNQENSPSVDRLDVTKGYEKENIWIICHSCNTKKETLKHQQIYTKSQTLGGKN